MPFGLGPIRMFRTKQLRLFDCCHRAHLGVVEGTVKIHVANIFGKLGVSDRTQALIEAIKRGIVQIE
jgi:hypothetical protein